MDTQFILGVGVGVFIGSGYRFLYEFVRHEVHLPEWMKGEPLRVTNIRAETRVFAATVDASIEPNHIPLMWKSRMRAFLFHAEMCKANARELERRIGLKRPKQMEYLRLLMEAELIRVQERKTSVWLTDWETRHRAIATLPYPRNVEPPDFITLPALTDATDRAHNRQEMHR